MRLAPVCPGTGFCGRNMANGHAFHETLHVDAVGSIRARRPSNPHVALFAKVSPKSSSDANNLGATPGPGLIEYPAGGRVSFTDDGCSHPSGDGAPTAEEEPHDRVAQFVGAPECRTLDALISAHPEPLERGELAEHADFSAASSGVATNSTRRARWGIDYPGPA
jgi:hypothetical protein